MNVELQVNGRSNTVSAELTETLLTTLRERLALTAAKRGCNQGVCGACTVLVDDTPMRACLSLTANCAGSRVQTLEGGHDDRIQRALEDAFVELGAVQCGFCTAGMLVTARALLAEQRTPDDAAIRTALSGNLCRCTGYVKIIAAVRRAGEMLK